MSLTIRMRRLAACLALGLLAACSPEYDWREADVADGRARTAFPAKVQTEQRQVALAGVQLPFTLTMARKDSFIFAVGHTVVPPGADAGMLAQALMASWYVNTGANPPATPPALGQEVDLVSAARGVSLRFMARAIVTDGAIIEAMVTGPSERFPEAQAREFLRLLRPRKGP
ncbi:hypothetical protein V8Z80_07530 [Orrella sp. JC864]|uniref:hypothetical protein n=1 Tax=Orrella sp. JC864 TaxID=3120298 RepID=UPI0012BC5039